MTAPHITAAHQSVVAQTVMGLYTDHEHVAVGAELQYHSRDPFAVRVVFTIPGSADVEWVFARDLMIGGLLGPAGTGDVQLFPTADGLVFELNSPGGQARLLADRDEVTAFCRRMINAVAPDQEHLYFDIDQEMALLAD